MTKLIIEQWYAQPIHCPFCGSAIDEEAMGRCDHWLYTAYDSFLHLSDRVLAFYKIDDNDLWDGEVPDELSTKYGSNYEVVEAIKLEFFNIVEFDLPTPLGDGTVFGFAPLDRELVYWGNDHVSPYDAKHKD